MKPESEGGGFAATGGETKKTCARSLGKDEKTGPYFFLLLKEKMEKRNRELGDTRGNTSFRPIER